jgi:pyruvate/2-oxoglutarate dehydrogenase complex dihydrolipoamide acyltransferase (E2) component
MAVDVRLPVLGDFMLEGTLVEWLRPDGARVEKGEVIYRLETDKVSLDVEAPASGVLRQVAAAGAVVPVNGLLGQIGEDAAPPSPPNAGGEPAQAAGGALTTAGRDQVPAPGATAPDAAGQPAGETGPVPAAQAGASGQTLVGSPPRIGGQEGPIDEVRASPAARRLARELGVDLAAVARANRGMRLREEHVQAFAAAPPSIRGEPVQAPGAAAPDAAGQPAGEAGPVPAAQAGVSGQALVGSPPRIGGQGGPIAPDVRASPAARRLARELGVDLAAVARASDDVALREAHVQAYAERTAFPSPPNAGREQLIGGVSAASRAQKGVPLAGRRRVIAQRMQQSLQQMAQLTVSQQVDVTECVRLRDQLVRLWAADGVRPTYTDFVVRAAALALREHPALNATLEDDALVAHATIDVGLAVDAPEGLIVPVLRGADGLSLRDLARQAATAAEQARANRLGPDALQGGTFTMTTLGALGIDFFTPIVNPPQVAIIGIGRVFPWLTLVGGQVEQRQAIYLNLSFDHRAVDGAPAARFLNRVKELLELPVGLL